MAMDNNKRKLVPFDFCIRYNPYKGETQRDITRRLFYTLIIKRIKARKPTVWFIGGDSGEGKSSAGLSVQDILCEAMGINLYDVLEYMNVFHPVEYPSKLDNLLYSKDKIIKKLPFLCIHEARTVVRSKDWNTMLSTLISDVNAMSRTIKCMCTIVISQFIRDVNTDVRYTMTYYSTITRPLDGGNANLRIFKLYKDDRDLEKPKLKKRRLQGYILTAKVPDPQTERDYERKWVILNNIQLSKTRKEVYEKFEQLDKTGKSTQIRDKLNQMVEHMKMEMGVTDTKINKLAEFYLKDLNSLSSISKKVRGNWRLTLKARDMHGLDKKQVAELEILLNDGVKLKNWNRDILAGNAEIVEDEAILNNF